MNKFYFNTSELVDIVYKNLHKIPHDIDAVVCIARGGLIPGTIISEHFNIPITTVSLFLSGRDNCWLGDSKYASYCTENIRKILVIDDSSNSGNTLSRNKQLLNESGWVGETIFCCIHGSPATTYSTPDCIILDDSFSINTDCTRIYQMNMFRTLVFNNFSTDLDGVLCEDPPWGCDKDEDLYRHFLKNARPYIKTPHINYIITARLEKYRAETEKWLQDHGITYNGLIMSPLSSVDEKLSLMHDGDWSDWRFKTNMIITNNLTDYVFIESNLYEATNIFKNITKKIYNVYCTEVFDFITDKYLKNN